MRKISITEALVELKLYDSRITKAIETAKFVGSAKKSADKVDSLTKEEFCSRAKASYQSVTDLIANRNTLKAAIVKSNAATQVEVNGKTMTVAEVIERKSSISYDTELLREMKEQYAKETGAVARANAKVDEKVDELILTLVGKDSDKKLSEEDQKAVEEPYRRKNEFELIDPLSLLTKIEALEAEIDGFVSNCDVALTMSNSVTFIEVDF